MAHNEEGDAPDKRRKRQHGTYPHAPLKRDLMLRPGVAASRTSRYGRSATVMTAMFLKCSERISA